MGRTQELSLTIEAPAADVWKALTDAEELTRWFVPEARVVPGVGGSLWMSWGGGMEGTSHITDWEPNRRMRTADELPSGGNPNPNTVDWQLTEEGGRTHLRLLTGGFVEGPKGDAAMESMRRGWTVFLYNLKQLVEHHLGRPGGQHYVTLMAEGLTSQQLWDRVVKLVSPEPRPGARVTIADVPGEVVLFEQGAVLGIALDSPKGSLLQVLSRTGC